MSIREKSAGLSRSERDRWPLDTRSTDPIPRRDYPMPQNHFAVDDDPALHLSPAQKRALLDQLLKEASTQSQVIDISRPVHIPYNPRDPKNEFPKVLYSPGDGKPVKVHSREEEDKLVKKQKYTAAPPVKPAEVSADE